MNLNKKEKVEVALTLIKENNSQIIWLKDLDFKITYYTIVFMFAILAWLGSSENAGNYLDLLFMFRYFSVLLLVASILFLIRNHITHSRIRLNNRRMLESLGAFKKRIYVSDALVTYADNATFHLGRALYAIVLIISCATSVFGACYLMNVAGYGY